MNYRIKILGWNTQTVACSAACSDLFVKGELTLDCSRPENCIISIELSLILLYIFTGQRICIGKRDIGFIVDSSGSIRSHYGIVKSFVKNVAEEIGISLSGTRAGVLLFSDNAILKVKLNQFDNTADFNNAVDNLDHLDSGTYIGLAIKTALEQLFTIPNGMRINVPNVLILLTDGLTHDPEIVATAVRQIRKVGIKLVVIGIGESVSKTQLLKIVEESEHLYLPKTFQDLLSKKFINNIVSELCHVKGKEWTEVFVCVCVFFFYFLTGLELT